MCDAEKRHPWFCEGSLDYTLPPLAATIKTSWEHYINIERIQLSEFFSKTDVSLLVGLMQNCLLIKSVHIVPLG